MIRQIWQPGTVLPSVQRSVALGVFDGMHLGHRAVIAAARNVTSPTQDIPLPTVTVFSLLGTPKQGGRLISESCEDRQAESLGVDEWLSVPFESVRELTPEAFVQEILHDALHAMVVCCGYNFRFGKDGSGDAACLRRLCEPLGIEVRVAPAVTREESVVSSTEVRAAVEAGDVERARRLLGRTYTVDFPVQSGAHLGSAWGVPTLNQPFPEGYTVPRYGVYASLVVLDGVMHHAITNVGVHPTVGGTAVPQAETYIKDYSGDLYGKSVTVELVRFLREERCFDTVEALRRQIAADIATADEVLDGKDGTKAILFDFDDTLQDRVIAFRGVAREMIARAFPQISEEELQARTQEMLVENKGGYVNYIEYFELFRKRWNWSVVADLVWWEYQRRFPFYSVLLPNAEEVLRELKRRGYRLGVITNGEMPQQNLKLDFAGIRPLLDIVLVAGEEDVGKPHAEVFRRAAQRLCVSHENCTFVGDYPPTDIAGAIAADMTPLYIDVHGANRCPEGVEKITSLLDLLERF